MAVSGPIARSIADLELTLSAMAFPDPRDPWQVPIPLKRKAFPKRVALALAPDGMPVSADVQQALKDAADALRAAGWKVEERDCPPMRRAAEINARLWMADTQLGASDMIAREGDRDAEFVFAQMLQDAGDVGVESLMTALQDRVGLMRQWELFFMEYALLLCPVSGELPFDQQRDVRSEEEFAQVFEAQLTQRALPVIGVPALSLATGEVGGRPVGVQLVSGRFREDVLLSAGGDLEAAFGAPPVASSG
jgi:amidase